MGTEQQPPLSQSMTCDLMSRAQVSLKTAPASISPIYGCGPVDPVELKRQSVMGRNPNVHSVPKEAQYVATVQDASPSPIYRRRPANPVELERESAIERNLNVHSAPTQSRPVSTIQRVSSMGLGSKGHGGSLRTLSDQESQVRPNDSWLYRDSRG
jgi:hypothetical protein